MIEWDTFKVDELGRTRRERNAAFGEEKVNPRPIELETGDDRILDLFWSISRFRNSAMSGIAPLQPDQIIGWMSLNQVHLSQDEIDLIVELDRRYRISMGREMERDSQRKASQKPAREQYKEMM